MVAGYMYHKSVIKKVLIVAPLSILGVWEEEFNKFANFPNKTTVLKGTLANKKKQILDVLVNAEIEPELQVVIVNYESSWRLEKELLDYDADLIIADEGHKLKEGRSAQSKGMHHLGDKAKYKLLLTGTIITNKEIDVYSQYRFLDKGIFGDSFFKFRNRYFDMGGYGLHTPIFKKSMLDDFLKKLHSIAFRVTKEECLDLPDVMEEERIVELEPDALKIYKKIEHDSYVALKDGEVTAPNILTRLLRLSQISGGHLTDDEKDLKLISTAKLEALSDIIESCLRDDKKVVVMARFVPELNDIENYLHLRKIEYAVVRGGIKDRDEQIKNFQENPNCKVFVGQIAAAGLGITLTASSTMVFYSMDYSMSNFEQAKARIHRAGQKNNCLYIYLIAKDTVDRKVVRALRNKKDLATMLIDQYRSGTNPFESK